jgi:hypothetical protein
VETGSRPADQAWKAFVRRHWKLVLAGVGGVAGVAVAALAVFLWVVANTQANGLVPSGLGDWSAGSALTFILQLVLWELLLVASWAVPVAAAAFFLWYKKLPEEERRGMEGAPRRGRAAGGGGGVSFFVFLVWLLIVWSDGRWNLALRNWTFNELVNSWIAAGLVVVLVAGVPALLYLVWVLRKG